jgi:hypothetical protein
MCSGISLRDDGFSSIAPFREADVLTYSLTDHPWTNLQWLTDVGMASLWSWAGADGLVLVKAAAFVVLGILIVAAGAGLRCRGRKRRAGRNDGHSCLRRADVRTAGGRDIFASRRHDPSRPARRKVTALLRGDRDPACLVGQPSRARVLGNAGAGSVRCNVGSLPEKCFVRARSSGARILRERS